jgi:DMSO/TMAO reductase YedYZ molybdopterin-dependent catalytic subunit
VPGDGAPDHAAAGMDKIEGLCVSSPPALLAKATLPPDKCGRNAMSDPTRRLEIATERLHQRAATPVRGVTRRRFLEGAGIAAGAIVLPPLLKAQAAELNLPAELSEGARAAAVLDALPGKKPLIKLTYRPPNYETPIEYFRTAITPNDAFFVRYHNAVIPEVDAKAWKVAIGGEGANGKAEVTLDDLKRMPAAEVVAVNLCSGARRGLFRPHVTGVEWGYGAMGCARWKGVRLKALLDKVGVKKEAIEVVFDGADGPVVERTPDFIKSIPVWKAMEESTLVAYEMNGEPLPHFNGFPARIIVPGWTGTYWMKHVTSISVATKPESGFWMNPAYRIPLGKFPLVTRFTTQDTPANTPITEMVVNSLITSHAEGASVKAGASTTVAGIAWDGGPGFRQLWGRTWGVSRSARSASRSRQRRRAGKR